MIAFEKIQIYPKAIRGSERWGGWTGLNVRLGEPSVR